MALWERRSKREDDDRAQLTTAISQIYLAVMDQLADGVHDRALLLVELDRRTHSMSDDDLQDFVVAFGTYCFVAAAKTVRSVTNSQQDRDVAAARIGPYCCAVSGLDAAQFREFFERLAAASPDAVADDVQGPQATSVLFAMMATDDALRDGTSGIEPRVAVDDVIRNVRLDRDAPVTDSAVSRSGYRQLYASAAILLVCAVWLSVGSAGLPVVVVAAVAVALAVRGAVLHRRYVAATSTGAATTV